MKLVLVLVLGLAGCGDDSPASGDAAVDAGDAGRSNDKLISADLCGAGTGPQIAVAPDGSAVAFSRCGDSNQVVVHNLQSGAEIELGPARDGFAVQFSPNGQFLIFGGPDAKRIRPIDASTDAIDVTDEPFEALSFTPDGQTLVALSESAGGTQRVIARDADGTNPRTLAESADLDGVIDLLTPTSDNVILQFGGVEPRYELTALAGGTTLPIQVDPALNPLFGVGLGNTHGVVLTGTDGLSFATFETGATAAIVDSGYLIGSPLFRIGDDMHFIADGNIVRRPRNAEAPLETLAEANATHHALIGNQGRRLYASDGAILSVPIDGSEDATSLFTDVGALTELIAAENSTASMVAVATPSGVFAGPVDGPGVRLSEDDASQVAFAGDDALVYWLSGDEMKFAAPSGGEAMSLGGGVEELAPVAGRPNMIYRSATNLYLTL
ncbi:MAG: hypothetical protein AAGF12_23325 [Myxococcota bacterium]